MDAPGAPGNGSSSPKDFWDKLRVVLYGVLVVGVVWLGYCYKGAFQREQARRQHNVEMLKIAVEILREDPSSQRRALREWAVNTMDTFSTRTGVPLRDSARRILLNQALTDAGPVTTPGTRSWSFVFALRQRLYDRGVNPASIGSLLPLFLERQFDTTKELVSYVADGGDGRSPTTYLTPDSAYSLVRDVADSLKLVPGQLTRREFLSLQVTALTTSAR